MSQFFLMINILEIVILGIMIIIANPIPAVGCIFERSIAVLMVIMYQMMLVRYMMMVLVLRMVFGSVV